MSQRTVKKEIIFFAELGINITVISEEMVSPNQLSIITTELTRNSLHFNCQLLC